jgi:hypothetical protein
MTLYDDSSYPIATDIESLHAQQLKSFARPGTWWTAAERTAIAALARQARCKEGSQESIGDEALTGAAPLPAGTSMVARTVALGGIEIDRPFFDNALADGLSEEQYVETVAIVARLAHLDVFARGIGVPSRALEAPQDVAAPTRVRPASAIDEGFHAASIPAGTAGGDIGHALYGSGSAPNILRSLSLVPDEAQSLIDVMEREYMTPEKIGDFSFSPFADLSRPQVELVAAKISALNQCFY